VRRERGQAVVETILIGLLLLVPLIWALGVLADMHRSALALTAAAREGGAEAARADSRLDAERALDRAVVEALVDHGLDPGQVEVQWSGSPQVRGGVIEINVRYPVTVLQAPLIGRVAGPSAIVEARHVVRVDPYRSRD
jgi:hypothetical protein